MRVIHICGGLEFSQVRRRSRKSWELRALTHALRRVAYLVRSSYSSSHPYYLFLSN